MRALAAIREARETVELLAKMAGELRDGTTVNVLVNPQWLSIQAVLLEALVGRRLQPVVAGGENA